MKDVQIEEGWKKALGDEFQKPYFQTLREFVRKEYQSSVIYPPAKQIFAAFDHCPFDRVKVVILGQDPYHGQGQANGLCFSVQPGIPFPPSLQNIFKEIQSDLGKPIPKDGDLSRWAGQGVLLLNASLTVKANQAGSHQNQGWEDFTHTAIRILAENTKNLVFLLWGSFAQKKEELIDKSKHLVLKSPHPSPLSAHRGFFGNKHFSKTNEYLKQFGKEPIDW
ncbi:uracil-DNA glycosylase [Leptospira ilyithenensis]|uniref:Uracil-DNA glycosylase n=1 Tax=Leptospira ilyithenensis TaxID=2484901 RepID=A0A4R9LSZ1_9LEPT|nr:uracil-DNA glycosylase [Leptospira ilyithenensis]TGN10544.1 uracil-DNA glycosylase [Leptospira ilyithenensis]